jgi:hypothetical protein
MSTAVATPLNPAEPAPEYVAYDGRLAGRRRRLGFMDLALADSPWRVGDFVRAVARLLLGLIVIIVAWAGASGTLVWRQQVLWTAVGAAGVLVAASGVFMWLLSGFGMVSRERREIRLVLTARYRRAAIAAPVDRLGSVDADTVVWGAGMRRYHLTSCDVVKGKRVISLSRDDGRRRGLVPCGMCQS